jgi:nucleoid-associated protein YgaU
MSRLYWETLLDAMVVSEGAAEAMDALRGEVKSAKERAAKNEGELAEAKRRIAAFEEERKRLLAMIKDDGGETVTVAAKPSVKEIKDLLDEDGGDTRPPSAGDVAALRREESLELASAAPLLAPRSADETAALKKKAAEEEAKKKDAAAPQRPETYEIREGDTLYKIAMKFYGTIHAWRKIRDANKAVISTDGRVKAGDTIKLP